MTYLELSYKITIFICLNKSWVWWAHHVLSSWTVTRSKLVCTVCVVPKLKQCQKTLVKVKIRKVKWKTPGIHYITERILSRYHLKKNFNIKKGEKKGKKGHLVSIKKIKWFTWSLLLAALLLGGVHAALHHHPVDTTLKASNSRAGFLNQKLIVIDIEEC